MAVRNVPLSALEVNRANDRHGELENETAAIAWLFNTREAHMRNLTKDIVEKGEIFELPLVGPGAKDKYVVYDGNRRVTCLKLLAEPRRAPTGDLQTFFAEQRSKWRGTFPSEISCQVESDRERIDDILFRRHTGTQNGVGQSTWDDRMKQTFVARTGKGGGINVADEIEKRLKEADKLPGRKKIPRSTMNRLLSSEPFRNRLGFSTKKGKFEFTHDEEKVLSALGRVAHDLANKKLVLGHIWDVDGKREYLDGLEQEGLLPSARDTVRKSAAIASTTTRPPTKARPKPRTTLIPQTEFGLPWPGRLQRQRHIWEELQFRLELSRQPNAISVLFRVLLELSVENYIVQKGVSVHDGDKLAGRLIKVGRHLEADGKIDSKQMGVLTKFQHADKLVSADTLNRYVHSPNFAPSPEHLTSMWDSLADVICRCLEV